MFFIHCYFFSLHVLDFLITYRRRFSSFSIIYYSTSSSTPLSDDFVTETPHLVGEHFVVDHDSSLGVQTQSVDPLYQLAFHHKLTISLLRTKRQIISPHILLVTVCNLRNIFKEWKISLWSERIARQESLLHFKHQRECTHCTEITSH